MLSKPANHILSFPQLHFGLGTGFIPSFPLVISLPIGGRKMVQGINPECHGEECYEDLKRRIPNGEGRVNRSSRKEGGGGRMRASPAIVRQPIQSSIHAGKR